MLLDHQLDIAQAESAAGDVTNVSGSVEAVEDVRQSCCWDAKPVIRNGDHDPLTLRGLAAHSNDDIAAVRAEFDGVADQIINRPLYAAGIPLSNDFGLVTV